MAWLYVPDLEDLSEGLNPLLMATEPFAMSKGKPIPRRSWPLRWKKDKFLKHLSGLTCEPSKANDGVEKWIYSLEGSPANHIPRQENNLPTKTQETYGRTSQESLARFDPESSSWKTCQMSLSGLCQPYSKTFPKWGMMRHGVLWQLPTLERHIKEKGGSYWPTPTTQANMLCESMNHSKAHRNLKRHFATPTIPTPNASDGMRTNTVHQGGNLTLKGFAEKFPTPTASEAEKAGYYSKGQMGNSLTALAKRGELSFPTPTAREPNDIGLNLNRGRYSNDTLTRKVSNLEGLQRGGRLNPQWVEWLMGWPIGFTELEDVGTE